MEAQKEPILEVKNLTKKFGGLVAVDNVTLEVYPEQIVALIGPNGAGKTTFFNCVTGIYKPTSGDIFLKTKEGKKVRINGLKPNQITELGLARTFQNIRLFPNMTALENVMIGRHCRTRTGILGAIFRPPKTKEEEEETIEKSYQLLKTVGLEKYVNELAKNLPYGAQRRLEIARALATEPTILLLDEPAAGMNPKETAELMDLIYHIRDNEKIAILLIEHDMKLVMNISEMVYVMEYGRLLAKGTPEEIRRNPDVIKAYLGEEHNA
ncbi:ABC transporter ATP-binding protein [Desulfurobacterium atlanticum]|uniref:Amino acid/amide ABC transporter ATP-binding protein 1, HAAT family n=1 Tax=Desulfurobacterium atlanticum TaxID=240169 RepID=A0A238ZW15_9BACT|nr:ABC transporter ATP-binding protein [Desulfurobacterium atlanticum]SNR86853.1 amino acid/amide ABC transporter ATP-binding protein 1, HAAT family [Desulfurobacterium atlanticum]